jgi:hypothetical protein
MPVVSWVKKNKLSTLLLGIILLWILKGFFSGGVVPLTSESVPAGDNTFGGLSPGLAMKSVGSTQGLSLPSMPINEPAPVAQTTNRMVVQNSNLSLLVKDVSRTVTAIRQYVPGVGGYMVDSSVNRPEEGGTGTITIRVPSDKLDTVLTYLRGLAVKVVSENLEGTDVTDQYVDNDARLAILEGNKARFEQIMAKAVTVDDILQVQQQIFNLQQQIDAIHGQQNYLEKTSQMAKITIYLSTDELALPYAPAQPWRPEVVFKYAVRSLLSTLQNLGTLIIWVIVYAVIWVPIVVIYFFFIRRRGSK